MQIHNLKISGSPLGVNPQCSRDPAHFSRVSQRTNYPLQSIPKVVLKKMLGHLTCIIFTYYRSTCGRCLECSHNYLQCKQLASHLPPTHKRVFDYLTGWLSWGLYHDSYFLSISSRSSFTLCQEWYWPQDPGNSLLQSLLEGNTFPLWSFTNLNHISQDPPGTNYGTGLRAKTAQQMCDRWIPVFISQV